MVHVKASLAAAQAYVAGKQAPTRKLPPGVTPARLSANENPFGPLSSVRDAMVAAVDGVNRYPDPSGRALREGIAQFHSLEADQVIIGAGAGSLCERAVLTTCDEGDEVVYAWPSFIGYRNYSTVAGARGVTVDLDASLRHDLDAMRAAITDRTRVVIVCNPNNPTGTGVGQAALEKFVQDVPDECLVLIDEAYIEFAGDPEDCGRGRELIDSYANVLLARTFSKAYGLAGLRAGYLLGQAATIATVARAMTPFQINSVGQAAALACLAATDEMAERVAYIQAGRAWLTDQLRALEYDVPECHGNFVWIPLDGNVDAVAGALEGQGILARPSPSGVRITIGTDEENARVAKAFAQAREA